MFAYVNDLGTAEFRELTAGEAGAVQPGAIQPGQPGVIQPGQPGVIQVTSQAELLPQPPSPSQQNYMPTLRCQTLLPRADIQTQVPPSLGRSRGESEQVVGEIKGTSSQTRRTAAGGGKLMLPHLCPTFAPHV